MAVYTVANGGGNINAGATYVGGIAPSSTDTIDFTATSGQLTVNTNFTIAGIDFTNYVNTLTMSAVLSVNGNVTLVAGMTIAGASRLSINATSTITSNGKTWPNAVDFNMTAASQTVTVADDWNITGTVSFLTNIATFNGNKISVGGSLTNNTNGGTTLFELVGTGTWTSSGFKNSLTINTAGTITFSGTVHYNTGTLTYTAGTVVTTSSTLSLSGSTITLDTSGITWNNITFSGTTTVTLLSDLNVYGLWTVSNPLTLNGFNINLYAGATITSSSAGTTIINVLGTGTFNVNAIVNNMNINTAGTMTFTNGSTFFYGIGTLTYISGAVVTTNMTLRTTGATATFNTSGMSWYNFFNGGATVTLNSDLNCTGTLTIGGISTFNNNNINVGGSLVMTSTSTGTTQINLTGTGTWSGSGQVRNNLTIKSTAIIDIVGNVQFNTGTFIVESGANVNTSNSTLSVIANATTTFDISTIKLNNFYLGGGSTVNTLQLNSPLYITGTAYLGASSQPQTINGSPVYIESGTLSSQAGNGWTISGTSEIIGIGDKFTYLDSATPVYNGQGLWRLPITINVRGTILMYGRLVISTGGTFTILNGTVDHRDGIVNRTSLLIQANTTLTNIDKCKFKNITITAGITITMNKFFTGSPEFKTVIRSTTTVNYNITFTDTIPKKAYFVNVKNCTVNQTLVTNQLNIIGRDSNSGLNSGIVFGESGLCGFPLNQYGTENSYSFADGFSQGGMNN